MAAVSKEIIVVLYKMMRKCYRFYNSIFLEGIPRI